MAEDKVEIIHSRSIGQPGRAISRVRGQELVLDASSHPRDDALTNSEAFLAGISSCGVTLIESYADAEGIPIANMDVDIKGVRTAIAPNQFAHISMHFKFEGTNQQQAERLVQIYRER